MKSIDTRIKIFLTAWLVYLLFIYVKPESMSAQLLDLAMSIVDTGSVYMRYATDFEVSLVDGRYVSGQFPGASIAVVPLYFVIKPFMGDVAGASRLVVLNVLSTISLASVAGALVVVVFYSFLRRLDVRERDRLTLTFFLAFGTMVFNYSTSFYKSTLALLYVFAAFFLLFRVRLGERAGRGVFFWTGFLLTAAVATNPASCYISAVIFAYGIYVGGIKKVPAFLAGAVIPLGAFMLYRWTVFGSFFTSTYSHRAGDYPNMMTYPRWQNFIHLFFSLREGFFIYMPVMILSLWGIAEASGKKRFMPEVTVIVLIFLLTGLVFSGYVRKYDPLMVANPHDQSIVIRYMLSLCPFMMIPLAFVVSRVNRYVLYFLGGLGVFFSYLGAQAGVIPYAGGWQPVYAVKVFISGFGMPTLFSDVLPGISGVETLHTYLARPDVHLKEILSEGNRQLLMGLVGRQMVFFVFFVVAAFCLAVIIRGLWKSVPGDQKV